MVVVPSPNQKFSPHLHNSALFGCVVPPPCRPSYTSTVTYRFRPRPFNPSLGDKSHAPPDGQPHLFNDTYTICLHHQHTVVERHVTQHSPHAIATLIRLGLKMHTSCSLKCFTQITELF